MATADIPESFWAEFDAEFGEEIAGLTESDHWWYVRGETDISDAKERGSNRRWLLVVPWRQCFCCSNMRE